MKATIKIITMLVSGSIFFAACKKDDNPSTPPAVTVYYQQQDQVGRPAINTVFNTSADKDAFNVSIPSTQAATYQPKFMATLNALNPAYVDTVKNALGLTDTVLTTVLATDVLNVSTTGSTKFFTSTTDFFTGRGLADDVIDNELILLFGGPTGASNPTLTTDYVNANDVAFLSTFPYEAAAH